MQSIDNAESLYRLDRMMHLMFSVFSDYYIALRYGKRGRGPSECARETVRQPQERGCDTGWGRGQPLGHTGGRHTHQTW